MLERGREVDRVVGPTSVERLRLMYRKKAEGGGRRADETVGSGQSAVGSKSEIENQKSEIALPPSAFRPPPPLTRTVATSGRWAMRGRRRHLLPRRRADAVHRLGHAGEVGGRCVV